MSKVNSPKGFRLCFNHLFASIVNICMVMMLKKAFYIG